MPLMDNVGLQIRESLPLVVDILKRTGMRDRVKVVASGKMINPSPVAAALCMGADFVVTARGFMFALGCIQAMKCNQNTCPTGITTHDKHLQRGLVPRGQGGSCHALSAGHGKRGRDHRAFVRRAGAALPAPLPLQDGDGQWHVIPAG